MALPWIDQQHLARADVARLGAIIEVEASTRDDERDGDRVAVLGHGLPRLEAKAYDPHRSAVGELLEPEGARRVTSL